MRKTFIRKWVQGYLYSGKNLSQNEKMKNAKKKVTIVILIILLAFIWGHSAMSRESSKAESTAVCNMITPFLELFVGNGNVTDHMVRKLAHFTEFFALGVVMAYLLHLYRKYTFFDRSYAALCGMAVAVIDESIQLIADGRGAQVQDVLLDTSGMLVGLLIIITATDIIRKIRRPQ